MRTVTECRDPRGVRHLPDPDGLNGHEITTRCGIRMDLDDAFEEDDASSTCGGCNDDEDDGGY